MATRGTESVTTAGLAGTYNNASVGGDKVTPGENVFLHVKNGSASAVTVTVVTPQLVDGSLAVDNRNVTVAANGDSHILVPATLYRNPTDGLAQIDWSATGSVTFAVMRA